MTGFGVSTVSCPCLLQSSMFATVVHVCYSHRRPGTWVTTQAAGEGNSEVTKNNMLSLTYRGGNLAIENRSLTTAGYSLTHSHTGLLTTLVMTVNTSHLLWVFLTEKSQFLFSFLFFCVENRSKMTSDQWPRDHWPVDRHTPGTGSETAEISHKQTASRFSPRLFLRLNTDIGNIFD